MVTSDLLPDNSNTIDKVGRTFAVWDEPNTQPRLVRMEPLNREIVSAHEEFVKYLSERSVNGMLQC